MLLETNPTDFDKLGEEAAGLFFDESTPLEEVVVKLASDHQLNPEEVKRLVEKANTYTSVKMIKASSDKTVEFDLADYDKVVAKTHPEGSTVSTQTSIESDVPAEMPNTVKDSLQKQASESSFFTPKTEKTASTEAAAHRPLGKVFDLQKKVSQLGLEKSAAELEFKKAADKLVSDFSSLYAPDFTKFANEAYTLYGESGKCLLDSLAETVREDAEFSKVAHVIDDTTDQMKLFKTAYDSILEVHKLAQDITEAKSDLEVAWREAKSG